MRGPKGELRGTTDEMGKVVFEGIPPGQYMIAASKQNYRADDKFVQQDKVTVLDQACPSGDVYLRTDSFVSGVLRMPDGTGVVSNWNSWASIRTVSGADTTADRTLARREIG